MSKGSNAVRCGIRFRTKAGEALRLLAPVLFLVVFGGCGGNGHHHGPPPTPPDEPVLEREAAADANALGWLSSFLDDPAGVSDPSYFVADFNLDQLDRTQYLDWFWTADDAAPIEGGVELVYLEGGNSTTYWDLFLNGSVSPYDFSLPVITEFLIQGENVVGEDTFSTYESLVGLFQMENTEDLFRFVHPGAWWEYEVLEDPPEVYQFVIDKLGFEHSLVYEGLPTPQFYVSKVEAQPLDHLLVDVILTRTGVPDAQSLPIVLEVTIRLFMQGTPADFDTIGFPNLGGTYTTTVNPHSEPVVSDTLVFPDVVPPGFYTVVVSVRNRLGPVFYVSDSVSFVVELF